MRETGKTSDKTHSISGAKMEKAGDKKLNPGELCHGAMLQGAERRLVWQKPQGGGRDHTRWGGRGRLRMGSPWSDLCSLKTALTRCGEDVQQGKEGNQKTIGFGLG